VDEYWQPYSWFAKKKELLLPGVIERLKGMKDAKRGRERMPSANTPGIRPRQETKRFHVYEWHGRYEDTTGEEQELVALVLPDEKVLAAYTPNWFYRKTGRRQFVHWCPIPRPHSFYGRGIPEMLRGIRSILDASINAGINRNHLFGNPPVLYNELLSGFNPARHKFGTGQSWGLKDINQVKLMELPRNEQQMALREELMFALVQRLLGINDFSLGASRTAGLPTAGAASNTATGITGLINEANIRFDMIIKLFQEWTHPELARQIFYHNRFNVDKAKLFRVTESPENPFQSAEPAMFGANPDFVFRGNTQNTNRSQEREDALLLYKVFVETKNPFMVDDLDNFRALTEGVAKPFDRQDLRALPPQLLKQKILTQQIQDRQMAQQAAIAKGMSLDPVGAATAPPGSTNGGGPPNGAPRPPRDNGRRLPPV